MGDEAGQADYSQRFETMVLEWYWKVLPKPNVLSQPNQMDLANQKFCEMFQSLNSSTQTTILKSWVIDHSANDVRTIHGKMFWLCTADAKQSKNFTFYS